jgi:hypothetical protein
MAHFQASSATSATFATSAARASGAVETVTRPEPGLARGVWEAPTWAFWAALSAVVVVSTLYALFRAGALRRPARAARRQNREPNA